MEPTRLRDMKERGRESEGIMEGHADAGIHLEMKWRGNLRQSVLSRRTKPVRGSGIRLLFLSWPVVL